MAVDGFSFFDGKFLAVDGKSNFDGILTAVTQHDGKFLAVDGFPFFDGNFLAVDCNSNFDDKPPLYRDRPPVRYFYVGKFTEHLPGIFLEFLFNYKKYYSIPGSVFALKVVRPKFTQKIPPKELI